MADHLEGFPVTMDVTVAWGEMDAFGHVNNIIYFRYFESARIEFLLAIGLADPDTNDGVGPILASTHCRFRLPLTFPDTVRVGARCSEIARDRFTMEYRIVSTAQDAVAAEGGGVVVAYDYRRKQKAALPDAVVRRIHELGAV
jgi:acyl-CoA thioester hydrolase